MSLPDELLIHFYIKKIVIFLYTLFYGLIWPLVILLPVKDSPRSFSRGEFEINHLPDLYVFGGFES